MIHRLSYNMTTNYFSSSRDLFIKVKVPSNTVIIRQKWQWNVKKSMTFRQGKSTFSDMKLWRWFFLWEKAFYKHCTWKTPWRHIIVDIFFAFMFFKIMFGFFACCFCKYVIKNVQFHDLICLRSFPVLMRPLSLFLQ